MARLSDLKLDYRLFMAAYPYRHIDWQPGTTLSKPLATTRLAVVTTAAFHLPDQAPVDRTVRGGDSSYREIPYETDLRTLRMSHKSDSFDPTGLHADANLALPLDRLRELAVQGIIGQPAPRHFSFMGSITAPGRLMKETAPEVAASLRDDGVDAVLLTPA